MLTLLSSASLAGALLVPENRSTPEGSANLLSTIGSVLRTSATDASAAASPQPADVSEGRPVALLRFSQRAPRLGPPPEWTVPAPFRSARHPALVVAVPNLDGAPELPFALRVSASDVRPGPRSREPAPVYHWSRGSVYSTLDAGPLRGRLLRIEAKVRLSNLFAGRTRRSPARFWVRVDGEDPSAVPLVHRDSEDEITAGWRTIRLQVPIYEDAEHVHLGLDVSAGSADMTEVTVRDLGPSGVAPPTPLAPDEVDRLVLLTRLLGYVRFFHPSDEAAGIDWDVFAIEAIETVLAPGGWAEERPPTSRGDGLDTDAGDDASKVEGASKGAEAREVRHQESVPFAETLRELFATIAPTLVIDGIAADPAAARFSPGLTPRPEEARRLVCWSHYGLGLFPGDHPYRSARVAIGLPATMPVGHDEALRDPRTGERIPSHYEALLEAGAIRISVLLPLALYSDADGTLPKVREAPYSNYRRKPAGFLPVSEDRTTRLAAAMMVWNVAQHFYPNFDDIECDWLSVLPSALRESATAPDGEAFADVLSRMLVCLQDGHAGVYPYYRDDSGRLPFEIEILEGRAWVSGVDPALRPSGSARDAPAAETSIAVGDELVSIDGVPIATRIVSLGDRVSAATLGSHQARTRERLLRGRIGETRRCVFRRAVDGDGVVRALTLADAEQVRLRIAEHRRPPIADLGHGVLYLDATRIDDAAFQGSLAALIRAQGVIVDCRGYPEGLSPRWLENWLADPARSPQWHVPVDRAPDRTARSYVVRDWTIEPRIPRIEAPTVFLTNAEAISRAETYLSIVKYAGIGTIVGSRTAGTNGNILPFNVPGGLRVALSGMRVASPDGTAFHGFGIVPDVLVEPTARGIRDGRDEVLERGLAVLRSGF